MKIFILIATVFLVAVATTSHAVCTMIWDPPGIDFNGGPMDPGDVKAYRVYVINKNDPWPPCQNPPDPILGCNPGIAHDVEIVNIDPAQNPPTNIQCDQTSITPGKKTAVTAVGEFGQESNFSNDLTSIHPGKPGNYRTEDIP